MSRLLSLFWKYNLPRWSILIIDLIICAFSLTLAFFLRFNFENIPDTDLKNLPKDYAILLGIRLVSFFVSSLSGISGPFICSSVIFAIFFSFSASFLSLASFNFSLAGFVRQEGGPYRAGHAVSAARSPKR